MAVPQQKPGHSKQDYCTPADFLDAAKRRLGISAFGHDFAADTANAKAATWFGPGSGLATDALAVPRWQDWCRDGWGWLNPPFSNIKPWAEQCLRMKRGGGSIAFLVPAAVGSNWFRDFVDRQAHVFFLNGRIHFMPDRPTWGYPKDCLLALFAPNWPPAYEVWTWKQPRERRRVA